MLKKLALFGAIGALALAVAGCDDDDAAPAAPAAFLSGTAAVGAAMSGGTVTVDCNGATTTLTTTVNSSGGYSISADDATAASAMLPCAIKVNYSGTDYFSLVQTGAKANVTPLTTLVVARALSLASAGTPSAWFTSGADLTGVTTHITAATNAVKTALENAATGSDTINFDLFTGTLVPGSTSDVYDTWLEAFQSAVGANYATLLNSFATSGTISGYTITLPELPSGTFNLTITGTYVFNGFNINIPSTTVQNLPAPDVTAVQQAVAASYGAAGTVTVTPLINTATQKQFRVQFSGTFSGVGTVQYNLLYNYVAQ